MQPLPISLLADAEWRGHVKLEKPRAGSGPHLIADSTVRGNRADDGDDPVIREKSRDEANTPDVLLAAFTVKTEAAGNVIAHHVAVEHVRVESSAE